MNLLIQLLINGLVNASLFIMIAIGFGLVYRTLYIFHIAYGGLYISAAYFLYTFTVLLKIPVFYSVILSILFTSLLGVLMEKVVYLPFYKRGSSSGVIMIASLGLFIVVENVVAMLFGNEVKVVSEGIQKSYTFKGIILTKIQVIELITGIVIALLFYFIIKKIKIFKALWAMGDEPELISVLGIPLFKLRTIVFALSSAFIAIPASLISIDVGMDPHMGMSYLLIAVVAVLFGGIDSYSGWILGAFILAELQSLAVWKFSSKWTDLITFTILVIVLLFRPQGILGSKRRLEEIK